MKFVKTKFFIVCVIVAAVMVLVPAVLAAFGQTDIIRSGLKTVAKPFEWCGSKIAASVDGFVSVFKDYDALSEENRQLKEKISELENQIADNEVIVSENKWLREYLDIQNNNASFELLDANVISYEAGNYSTVLTLNRGTAHGVKKNLPVITSDGVLGIVSEAGLDWCKVTSIIESSSKVGVYTDRTGVIGTVEGSLELRPQGKCLMSYDASADIKIGDRVYTSGTGSSYPSGLLIGKIAEIRADDATRRLIAVVEPAVDFTSLTGLSKVMLILGYSER